MLQLIFVIVFIPNLHYEKYNKNCLPFLQNSRSIKTSPVVTNSVVHDPSILIKFKCRSILERIFISQNKAVLCFPSNGSLTVFIATSVFDLFECKPVAKPVKMNTI